MNGFNKRPTEYDEAIEAELYYTAKSMSKKGSSLFNRIKHDIMLYGRRATCRLDRLGYQYLSKDSKVNIIYLVAESFPEQALDILSRYEKTIGKSRSRIAKIAIENHTGKKCAFNLEEVCKKNNTIEDRASLSLVKENQVDVNDFDEKFLNLVKITNLEIKKQASEYKMEGLEDLLVSIIVPARNVGKYIDRCLQSLLNQVHKNIEIIVVDDFSEDDTLKKIKSYADRRIRVITHDCQSGPYIARNNALSVAKGTFFTFLDGDDYAHPERIRLHLLKHCSGDEKLICTMSQWFRINEGGHVSDRKVWPLVRLNIGSMFALREEVISKIGFFHEIMHGADNEYFHRIKTAFGKESIDKIRLPLTYATRRNDSLTASREFGYSGRFDNPDRRIYWESWYSWHRRHRDTPDMLKYEKGMNVPFYIPNGMKVNKQSGIA
ncbi:glycosyltransferase family A protein [Salinicola lusitanus]|uniref:Glycosyltransferase family A protein n=1 Tax=Salinicola lusitanus TaxID=1949085 RepID=A0ABZ3CPI3_9GAMM